MLLNLEKQNPQSVAAIDSYENHLTYQALIDFSEEIGQIIPKLIIKCTFGCSLSTTIKGFVSSSIYLCAGRNGFSLFFPGCF